MNTRMFKNGFQSAMILVVVAILGLAGGTLIRDIIQSSPGNAEKVVVKKQLNDSVQEDSVQEDRVQEDSVQEDRVQVKKPVDLAQSDNNVPVAPEIPQFDILRVEKDGGVLVAGRTQPNNNVEVLRSNGEVLGKVKAERNGDFVITLDEQLARGEHILNLASTSRDGTKIDSAQTGVVFIPGASGEVLALINQEGRASRVATMPASLKSNTSQAAIENTASTKTASNENEPTVKLQPIRKVGTVEKQTLMVEAVEVEGKNVFVAGAVAPAALVRIYIDNVPVGSARGTADHRFLLEKKFNLSHGEHVVRADVINEKTGGVWSRVVVDLTHEVPEELLNLAGQKGTDLNTSAKVENVGAQVDRTKQASNETQKGDETVAQVDKVKQQVVVETTTTVIETAKMEKIEAGSTKVDVSAKVSDNEPTVPVVPKNVILVTPKKEEPVVQKKTETAANETITVTKIRTGQSLIVKWGDSLWRISRRTYGRGIRYTTIYNANRSQITDPDKIYVGQVFKLPSKTDL